MNSRIVQQFGIKYPFTSDSDLGYYLDTNLTTKDKVRSILMHVIFTPKGQKIRDPLFGTELIKYIFEMNDESAWEGVKDEINKAVGKYVPIVKVNNISILKSTEIDHKIFVRVDYSINNGVTFDRDSVAVQI